MSYILEALKKSDKKRQQDDIPDIQADHSLPPVRKPERKAPSWYFPGGIIIVLLCAGVAWLQFSDKHPAPSTNLPVEALPSATSLKPQPSQPDVIPEKPTVPSPTSVVKGQPIKQTAKQPAPPELTKPQTIITPAKNATELPPLQPKENSLPPLLEELPVAIRAAIPDLSFAGHVYSAIPKKRMIIINNRVVREGDLVSNGLFLEQIDADGVVLKYEASVFRVKLF